MAHSWKFGRRSVLGLVYSLLSESKSSEAALLYQTAGTICATENSHLYAARHSFSVKVSCLNLSESLLSEGNRPNQRAPVKEAQAALLDYLHSTRSLQFTDAEHMSKHSPNFLGRLLRRIGNEEDIGRSVTRFLRYHPINEFEPFFESLGLKPSEFARFLPRELMFLSDDELLLENYHVLCNYGIARSKIGKIYKEATQAFHYDYGVLDSKLRALENLGLSKTSVIKLAAASPSLLIGDFVNDDFVKVLEKLKNFGFQSDWICGLLSEKNSYRWCRILDLIHLFSGMGYSFEELRIMITKHPDFLLDGSGKIVNTLVGLYLKFGNGIDLIKGCLLQFPPVQCGNFLRTLRRGLMFFCEIEMEPEDVGEVMRTHPLILGICPLKKTTSILSTLNVGKKRLCGIIKHDPEQLKFFVLGTRLTPLPSLEKDIPIMQKMEFLVSIGFVENSDEMKRALKRFRGRGGELQERFDSLVKSGLNKEDVFKIVKKSPQILNQTSEMIEKKISFLVNNLGYPIESMVSFPSYISYTTERVKLRIAMYTWLKERGAASPSLALSTILATSDIIFVKQIVEQHPEGPKVWEKYKKHFSSD
ncbi:transcription termination factor MTEF18, mitochondrial-like [Aristolochia californica]|uniref:transcription termination factor MTEF18, mitochondrial-like n=1 Tax=Aristolochia californica TaxID=171875 RepID=UPI0035E15287